MAAVILSAAGLILAGCQSIESPGSDWKLVWQEEFELDGAVDPARWTFEEGFVRNYEDQYYTGRTVNCRQEKGCLLIEGRIENYPNAAYTLHSKDWRKSRKEAQYTSAALHSRQAFLYGRIEMRAKLPTGKGVWPAFWMLGECSRDGSKIFWPHCGEVDIMEYVGFAPDQVHSYIHYINPETGKINKQGTPTPGIPYDDFHTYAVEWDEEKMVFFFDNKPHFTYKIDDAGKGADNPFRKPQYLLVNLALGGSWGGKIDRSGFPKQFWVDYIRVWQKKQD